MTTIPPVFGGSVFYAVQLNALFKELVLYSVDSPSDVMIYVSCL